MRIDPYRRSSAVSARTRPSSRSPIGPSVTTSGIEGERAAPAAHALGRPVATGDVEPLRMAGQVRDLGVDQRAALLAGRRAPVQAKWCRRRGACGSIEAPFRFSHPLKKPHPSAITNFPATTFGGAVHDDEERRHGEDRSQRAVSMWKRSQVQEVLSGQGRAARRCAARPSCRGSPGSRCPQHPGVIAGRVVPAAVTWGSPTILAGSNVATVPETSGAQSPCSRRLSLGL